MSPQRRKRRCARAGCDEGSSVVEFVLIAPLVTLVAVALLHLLVTAHVRTTLASAATEGARAAALAGADRTAGEMRTREVLARTVSVALVDDIDVAPASIDGIPVVQVRITAHIPALSVIGQGGMTVTGHALLEV